MWRTPRCLSISKACRPPLGSFKVTAGLPACHVTYSPPTSIVENTNHIPAVILTYSCNASWKYAKFYQVLYDRNLVEIDIVIFLERLSQPTDIGEFVERIAFVRGGPYRRTTSRRTQNGPNRRERSCFDQRTFRPGNNVFCSVLQNAFGLAKSKILVLLHNNEQ